MKQVIFARTRWVYGSYTYLWRLVELAGFPVCYVDEIDLEADAVYIFTPANGELVIDGAWSPQLQAKVDALRGRPRKAILVWYYVERPGGETLQDASLAPETLKRDIAWATPDKIDDIWTHDRYFAAMAEELLCVPIGSDPRLREGEDIRPFTYDLCHFMYVNHRRSQILAGLAGEGLRIGPSDWGPLRNQVWNGSRACVTVHQSPLPGGEQLRFAVAAAWRMPLIVEKMGDPWPLEAGWELLEFDYDSLVRGVSDLVRKAGDISDFGWALHKKLCVEYPFRTCILDGVASTLRRLEK
jgi:hypothetical protein